MSSAIVVDPTASEALAGDDLPEDLRARVKAEVLPGERLLWTGRAGVAFCHRASWRAWAVWFVAIGLVGLAGSIAHRGSAAQADGLSVSVLLISMFLIASLGYVVALVMTIGERLVHKGSRSRIVYALTDRRAICWSPVRRSRGVEVATIPARSIGSVHRIELPEGSGDVIFGGNVPHGTFRGFSGVGEVRRVEALAREVLVDPSYRWSGPWPDHDD